MTAVMVGDAYVAVLTAEQQNMSVLAYRTGLFTSSFWLARKKLTNLPKNESELLKKPEPKKKAQSLQDQLAMARFMTQMMSKEVH